MSPVRMTGIEGQVLAAISTSPGEKDSALADAAGISRSTFSAARKRLLERGVFREIYVPDLMRFGYEILFISYVLFSSAAEANSKRHSWKHVRGRHRHFLTLVDGSKLVTMFAARNYTEVIHRTDIFEQHYASHGFLEQHRREYMYFPLGLSRIHSFLDFAPPAGGDVIGGTDLPGTGDTDLPGTGEDREDLSRHPYPRVSDLPARHPGTHGPGDQMQSPDAVVPPDLTGTERRLLRALFRNPSMRPGPLGKVAGMGRTTADKTLKGLVGRGLVRKKIFISPEAVGLEYLGVIRVTFTPASSIRDRRHLTRGIKDLDPVFFIESKKEAFLMFLTPDFQRMNEVAAVLQRIYENEGVLEGAPNSLFFVLPRLRYSVWDDFHSNLFEVDGTSTD